MWIPNLGRWSNGRTASPEGAVFVVEGRGSLGLNYRSLKTGYRARGTLLERILRSLYGCASRAPTDEKAILVLGASL